MFRLNKSLLVAIFATASLSLSISSAHALESNPGISFSYEIKSQVSGEQLNNPNGIALKYSGFSKKIYVADTDNNVVKVFTQDGTYQKSIGLGILNSPYDLAFDISGNLFVTDMGNNRVVRFNSNDEYVSEIANWTNSYGEQDSFVAPAGIAIFVNRVYVVDSGNGRIVRFSTSGDYQLDWGSKYLKCMEAPCMPWTTRPPTNYEFGNALGIAAIRSKASLETVYVTDTYYDRIQVYSHNGVYQKTIGYQGTGNGMLNNPVDLNFDRFSNLLVTDSGNNRVQVFDKNGIYKAQFGTYGFDEKQFNGMTGITSDLSSIFVVDSGNSRVQIIQNKTGYEYISEFGIAMNEGSEQFNVPTDIAFGPDGNFYVVDHHNNRIQKFANNGDYLLRFGTMGESGDGKFMDINGIGVNGNNDVFVIDQIRQDIQKFDSEGKYVMTKKDFGGTCGLVENISDIVFDGQNNAYVAQMSYQANRLMKLDANLNCIQTMPIPNELFINQSSQLFYDGNNIFLADTNNNLIRVYNTNLVLQSTFGNGATCTGCLNYVRGLAVDNNGNIFAIDGSNSIHMFNREGTLIYEWSFAGGSSSVLTTIGGISLSGHTLAVSDIQNGRVVIYSLDYPMSVPSDNIEPIIHPVNPIKKKAPVFEEIKF